MSNDARAYVTRYSPFRGATYAVHQATAEIVNPAKGWRLWIGRDRLAARARVSKRAVCDALDRLEAGGFLERMSGGAGDRVTYRFVFVRGLSPVVDDRLFSVDNEPGTYADPAHPYAQAAQADAQAASHREEVEQELDTSRGEERACVDPVVAINQIRHAHFGREVG